MYVLSDKCNVLYKCHAQMDDSTLYLKLKIYKNAQGVNIGNSHLLGMIFCLYDCMRKHFHSHVICFYYDRLSYPLKLEREL